MHDMVITVDDLSLFDDSELSKCLRLDIVYSMGTLSVDLDGNLSVNGINQPSWFMNEPENRCNDIFHLYFKSQGHCVDYYQGFKNIVWSRMQKIMEIEAKDPKHSKRTYSTNLEIVINERLSSSRCEEFIDEIDHFISFATMVFYWKKVEKINPNRMHKITQVKLRLFYTLVDHFRSHVVDSHTFFDTLPLEDPIDKEVTKAKTYSFFYQF